jgi:hypothetical protein
MLEREGLAGLLERSWLEGASIRTESGAGCG